MLTVITEMDEFIASIRNYMDIDDDYRIILEDFVKFATIFAVPAALDAYANKRVIVTRDGAFHMFYLFVAVALFHLSKRLIGTVQAM